MATQYAYYIDGRKISILKKYQSQNALVSSLGDYWGTPDADETSGIMFQYTVKINAPTDETTEINVNDFLALAVVEYVKYRLFEDSGDHKRSRYHFNQFLIKINENEDNYRGSPVVMMPSSMGSLR